MNPGIRYVQGMNEVLAPLYYVFRTDPNEENAVSFIPLLLHLWSHLPDHPVAPQDLRALTLRKYILISIDEFWCFSGEFECELFFYFIITMDEESMLKMC